jgi:hypothetical protein
VLVEEPTIPRRNSINGQPAVDEVLLHRAVVLRYVGNRSTVCKSSLQDQLAWCGALLPFGQMMALP